MDFFGLKLGAIRQAMIIGVTCSPGNDPTNINVEGLAENLSFGGNGNINKRADRTKKVAL